MDGRCRQQKLIQESPDNDADSGDDESWNWTRYTSHNRSDLGKDCFTDEKEIGYTVDWGTQSRANTKAQHNLQKRRTCDLEMQTIKISFRSTRKCYVSIETLVPGRAQQGTRRQNGVYINTNVWGMKKEK